MQRFIARGRQPRESQAIPGGGVLVHRHIRNQKPGPILQVLPRRVDDALDPSAIAVQVPSTGNIDQLAANEKRSQHNAAQPRRSPRSRRHRRFHRFQGFQRFIEPRCYISSVRLICSSGFPRFRGGSSRCHSRIRASAGRDRLPSTSEVSATQRDGCSVSHGLTFAHRTTRVREVRFEPLEPLNPLNLQNPT